MLPLGAQRNNLMPTSAGKDFYFTLLDHWGWSGNSAAQPIKHVGISITAVEAADITFSTPLSNGGGASPSYTRHMDAGSSLLSSFAYPDQLVLQGVNIHSTGDLYINIWVHGGTSSDQSVILPKHLLGKHYIVQGIPGSIIESGEGIPTPTYSQFTVVGTENGTNVSVTPRVNMVCRSRSDTLINAGQVYTTSIQENEVLLFQPKNYSHDISGTVVESDKAVAVFQGNNLTRFPADVNWADYTWEQARPTEAWGKEFIVAGTGRLVEKAFAITALEDNTQVEFYIYSMRYKTVTLNRGETAWGGENISGYGGLGTEYIKSDKPVCCYMYTTGCTQNNDKGDPSMAEILPVDHMATEAHWGLMQTDENGPFSNTLLVTTRDDNTDKVKFNNRTLSEYSSQSGVETYSIYGYTTYEIPQSIFGNLTTSGEGFSAYVVRVGKTAEAAAFNVTLPDPPPEEPCPDGKLLFQMTDKFVDKMWKELSGFCPGTKVSFSAYVSSHRYNESSRLVIKDPATMKELVQYYKYVGLRDPAESYDIGLSYTIPEGVSDLLFQLENSDNALVSSFEVRLCTPPVEIIAPDTVCIDTKNTFVAEFENDSSMAEPLQYQWYFSADSITWTPLDEGHQKQLKLKAKPRHTGWYKVAVAGSGNITNEMCRSVSEPHKFFVIEDCPPILCPDGILLFREDFGGNDPNEPRVSQTPVAGMTYNQLLDDYFGIMRGGSYLVTKMGYCNGDTSVTNPYRGSQWHLQDDHTYPGDYTRGYFMEVDGKGDNAAFYSTTINGLCAGSDLSFVAYVANVVRWNEYTGRPDYFAYPRLLFRLTDPTTNAELGVYDTGEIPFDSTFMNDYSCWQYSSKWHQVGMNFTVPEGLSSVQLTIYNNSRGTTGNDFAIDDIEVRLCMEPISISSVNPACRKKSHTFYSAYENWGTLESPEFMWSYSADSLTWTELQRGANRNYTIPVVHRSHEGWYRVTVANAGNLDMPNCRETSEPFKLSTQYCNTAVDQYVDTTACDTLLYYDLTWRGHVWSAVGTVVDTLRDIDIDDSVYVHKTLQTKICCPDIRTLRVDSAICDTLMPFLWFYQDTMLLFTEVGAKEIEYPHWRWENCIGEIHTLALDTFHCERLYLLIHNKYNWQLVCNNVELARIFPELHPLEFLWFKDSVAIEGANTDDYSEENELHGVFQLRIKLDQAVDNDDEYIWSNFLEILDTPAPAPVTKRIYNSSGMIVNEDRMTRGVYLIRYQQGDKVWTEKKVIQ